jgi:dihydroxyacetone kinase
MQVNNLGGTPVLELAIGAKELFQSAISARISPIVGPAPMMTRLDRHGLSISLIPAEEGSQRAGPQGRAMATPAPRWRVP